MKFLKIAVSVLVFFASLVFFTGLGLADQNQPPGGNPPAMNQDLGNSVNDMIDKLGSDAKFRQQFVELMKNNEQFRNMILDRIKSAGGSAADSFANAFSNDENFRNSFLDQFNNNEGFRKNVLDSAKKWLEDQKNK